MSVKFHFFNFLYILFFLLNTLNVSGDSGIENSLATASLADSIPEKESQHSIFI